MDTEEKGRSESATGWLGGMLTKLVRPKWVALTSKTLSWLDGMLTKLRRLKWVALAKWLLPVGLSYVLGFAPPVQRASLAMWDAIVSSTSFRPPIGADGIRLVVINGDDYRYMFNSRSPLESDSLAALVATAICGGASRVFVDLSTEDDSFQTITQKVALGLPSNKLCKSEPQPDVKSLSLVQTKVVWAYGYDFKIEKDGGLGSPPAVLGGSGEPEDLIAPVAIRADADGRVRRLPHRPGVKFLWDAAADALCKLRPANDPCNKKKELKEVVPSFVPALRHGVLKEISAIELMGGPGQVQGKVVFLGGDYSAGDRFYMADGGMHPGVKVLAAGALALTNDDLVDDVKWRGELLLELGLALSAFWLIEKRLWSPWTRLGCILVGLPLIYVAAALVLNMAIGFMLDLGALLFGILLEHSIEGILDSDSAGKTVKAGAAEK